MALGPDRKYMTQAQVAAASVDVGLRSYMLQVYNYMALGVAFTGIVALVVALNPALMQAIALGPMKWVLFVGILGLGFFAPRVIMSGSPAAAQAAFWVYAALWGALMAPLFYMYTGTSIVRVFFITSAAFAGLSLYGYTTKRDLAPVGAFLAMATFGILVALLVNMFLLQSSGFHLLLSVVVVLVFAGLTAYETQMIKNMYMESDHGEVTTRKAIFGAFLLYGSFVTLFIWLLQLFGVARE
ncbi:MAG: Bax inhibitor-1/YccA family protein [Alphaproteobacteria bacterium]|nr:MAG: Bax inhibitor-1/YccA family protein [Alphaproteobacteria bacterium]